MNFKGTGVALVTPFKKNGTIDFAGFEKLLDHVIKGKVEYAVPLGTTGESVTLTKDEKKGVFDFVAEKIKGKVPVVLGLGGNNTDEILRSMQHYDLSKAAAILSVSPYYNKPNQRGIIEHYKLIAKESPVPVILYNVPGRTGSNMTAETTLTLADEENIIGIKEASGNFDQVMKIIKYRPENFLVISGDDGITLPLISCGADGVISVVANSHPKMFSNMVRFALAGNLEKARPLHYKLTDFITMLFAEGSPGGVKAALDELGICKDHLRMPLANVSRELRKKIAEEIIKTQ